MNNAIFSIDQPQNEPIKSYIPGSPERKELMESMDKFSSEVIEIPLIIGGKEIFTGNTENVVMPHNHQHVLAVVHKAGPNEIRMAMEAAGKAHREWESTSWVERLSITMKMAELITHKYRAAVNATTMLGQSKSV